MAKKATHLGTCQVCGCTQKLPNGHLSLHGYTKQWGFFNGTCQGSKHLPFEQDISLIHGMIEFAKNEAKTLRQQAKDEIKNANPDGCWYHMYFSFYGRGEKSGYRWTKTRLLEDAGVICYNHLGDKRLGLQRVHAGLPYDLQGAANQLAKDYALYLEKEAVKRDKYAMWQELRIKDWKPKPLTPIMDTSKVGVTNDTTTHLP